MGPLVPYVQDAKENGFDDCLWLLDDYIKEMTAMNVFIVQFSRFGHLELVTPHNDTCIHDGVTRRTILDMKDWIEKEFDLKVVEREISIRELVNSAKEGRLVEVFAGATHTNLLPIRRIQWDDTTIKAESGDVTKALCQKLNDTMQANPGAGNKWITPFE